MEQTDATTGLDLLRTRRLAVNIEHLLTTNVRWCTVSALRRTLYNESKKVKRKNI